MFKEYFCREKTSKEIEEGQALIDKIKGFYNKVFGDEFKSLVRLGGYNQIGYTENYGYYAMGNEDRGYYDVTRGDTIDEAFWLIIRRVLLIYGNNYVRSCRKELREDFVKRFGTSKILSPYQHDNFFNLLYIIECAVIAWNKYYEGKIPDYIVKYYEEQLTKSSYYSWKFDSKTNEMKIV